MTLREKQSIFAKNIAKLILFAFENGFEITLGEAYRTTGQQLLYFEGYTLKKIGSSLKLCKTTPKSKTLKSKHIDKLAVDINLFRDGVYLTDKDSFRQLAEYWTKLHPRNISGYNWGWDYNHFQMS